ncbi:zinc ribbon domain-containing protein [Actinoplanes sp. NPDC051470]|uniref:zinc ribbon domain-containing protein n=1 Tax=unclassified Actinoplanes TaxID=2626549 RepID=UPI00342A04BF
MFLIFGLRTSDHRLGVRTMLCDVCGHTAAQGLVKRTTKFSLFFIPLFPVKRPTYFRECTHCGAARHLDDRHVASLLA